MSAIRSFKNSAHLFLAVAANTLHGFPSRKVTVIGVTGTDGKTTTTSLLYHILKESGVKVAAISTIGAVIDGERYETGFHVTTPSPFSVQKYIKLAVKKGCTHVILEVTSHALDQNRVWGIPFDLGILTNVTHEHLDYHKNYEAYAATKARLLRLSRKCIVNSNGEWFPIVSSLVPSERLISYSLHGAMPNDRTLASLPFTIKTSLLGDFNLENILAASITCLELGVDPKSISKAIESFEPPTGRQEIFEKNGIKIMVDFAHTANSFEKILPEVRKTTSGRIIHVFGCAGERDHKKRSEMGKAASFYDNIIILTAEDPRREKISDINRDIKEGISGFVTSSKDHEIADKSLFEIDDRRKAIKFALEMARRNDTIIITGKGHERSINYGHGEEAWSDQEEVKTFLKNA